MSHAFMLQPGAWRGEGKLTFSMAEDVLPFTMEWKVLPLEDAQIHLTQTIDIEGFSEKMRNHFTVFALTSSDFGIILENLIVTRVEGRGVIAEEAIAWEFRRPEQAFEGFEVYALQGDGVYKVHAEFASGDGFRTTVNGRLEKQRI